MTYELNQHQRDFLNALRSGKYPQAQGYLHDEISGGYCCLGVGCVLADVELVEDEDAPRDVKPKGLPKNVLDEIFSKEGVDTRVVPQIYHGRIPGWLADLLDLDPFDQDALVNKNDSGQDFNQIADWLEFELWPSKAKARAQGLDVWDDEQ